MIVLAPIADNGAGVLTLVKSGVGTLTLSGINTYTGGTVLNAGTVRINNANSFGASTGTVTVNGNSQITAPVASPTERHHRHKWYNADHSESGQLNLHGHIHWCSIRFRQPVPA